MNLLKKIFGKKEEISLEQAKREHGITLRNLPEFVQECLTHYPGQYRIGFVDMKTDLQTGRTTGKVYTEYSAGKKVNGIFVPDNRNYHKLEIKR